MQLPAASHPIWKKLVSGQLDVEFEFFAAQLLVMRLRQVVAGDPSSETLDGCAREAWAFFDENAGLDVVRVEAEKLIGELEDEPGTP